MADALSTEDKKALFLIALKELHGNITHACQVAGLGSRTTYYNWIETDEDFKGAVRGVQLQVTDEMLDEAEDVVRFALKKADKDVAKWILSRLGRHRGYGVKVEVEHSGDAFKGLEFPETPDLDTWSAQAGEPVDGKVEPGEK